MTTTKQQQSKVQTNNEDNCFGIKGPAATVSASGWLEPKARGLNVGCRRVRLPKLQGLETAKIKSYSIEGWHA